MVARLGEDFCVAVGKYDGEGVPRREDVAVGGRVGGTVVEMVGAGDAEADVERFGEAVRVGEAVGGVVCVGVGVGMRVLLLVMETLRGSLLDGVGTRVMVDVGASESVCESVGVDTSVSVGVWDNVEGIVSVSVVGGLTVGVKLDVGCGVVDEERDRVLVETGVGVGGRVRVGVGTGVAVGVGGGVMVRLFVGGSV